MEYISYEPINSKNELIFKSENNKQKKESKNPRVFIFVLLIIIIIIIIVGIILCVRCCNKKNEEDGDNILKQVEMCKPIEYDDILLDRQEPIN